MNSDTVSTLRKDAERALKLRRYEYAHKKILELLYINKNDADAFILMAMIPLETGNIDKAIELIKRAISLAPENHDYPVHLAKCYALQGDMFNAALWADKSSSGDLSSAFLHDTLGVVLTRIGLHQNAEQQFVKAVSMDATSSDYIYNLASSQKFLGQLESAKMWYRRALEINPRDYKAYIGFASLDLKNLNCSHIKELTLLLESAKNSIDKLNLSHALALEHEKVAQYDQAFEMLHKAKQQRLQKLQYSFAQDQTMFDSIVDAFSDTNATFSAGYTDSRAIFVTGMPRTGTTLVERIISGHDGVKSVGELHNFELLLKSITGGSQAKISTPQAMQNIVSTDFYALGKAYLDSVAPLVSGKDKFVDKLPLNLLHAGFIIKALPNCKIICLDRDPLDTIVSNYRQVFSAQYRYCDYSLCMNSTAKFYIQFKRVRALWQSLFPDNFYVINYQRLVNEPAHEAQKLAKFCGINYQQKSLQIDKNTSPVATASALQVREPIHNHSIGRWRHYEPYLKEVISLLKAENINIKSSL